MSATPNKRLKSLRTMTFLNTEPNSLLFKNNSKGKIISKEIKKENRSLIRNNTFFETKKIKQLDLSEAKNIQNNYNNKYIENKKLKIYDLRKINNSNSNSKICQNNISNLRTQGNSATDINDISKNTFSEKKNKTFISKNSINFLDRLKLKTTKVLGLKLYEQFEEDKRKINKNIFNNEVIKINNNSYDDNKIEKENEFLEHFMINDYKNMSIIKKNKNKKNRNIQYSLKQLMKLNPYHYVSTRVRYNNAVEMEKISEKLSNVNSVKPNQKTTSKLHFFKNDFNKKVNTKLLKTVKVQFNNNLSYKGGLVWRILSKLQKNGINSEFRQICKFQGYTELWTYYRMLLEKLILNYPLFKWFLEKETFMEEDVFKEYLQCLKMDIVIDESFPRKVFLIFDDTGEGKINTKDFFFIMKLTSSTSDIDKLKFFMKLFEDVNKSDVPLCINVLEMFEVMKKIISFSSKRKIKMNLLKNLRKEFNDDKVIDKSFYITKDQMINFLINNKLINKIIDNFKRDYKYAYINYNEKINNIFFNTVKTVKKFINEQNEVTSICRQDIINYEKVLDAIEQKDERKAKINEYKNYIEVNE